MDLFQQFQEFISKHRLFDKKDKLLLAVSGGADSAVLLDLCARAGYQFSIAHCNFQLRGEESDRDEAFVRSLAEKNAVPLFTKKFDTAAFVREKKLSIEEAARDLRYGWFTAIMQEAHEVNGQAFRYLLTAHHADDNIETVMMNFFRGTGIKGIRGILPKQQNICRPLLFATREDIESYANENKVQFITDSSNASNDHTRNYFRNELIPGIEKVYPAVKQNILNNIERFSGVEEIYTESMVSIKKKLLESKGNEIFIPALKLAKMPACRTLIHEIIKDFGFTASQVSETEKLLESGSGKYILSRTHRILRDRQWLIISPLTGKEEIAHFIIEKDTDGVSYPGGVIKITATESPVSLNAGNNTVFINAGELTYPLLLRPWKKGDYFYPLGMRKKKKLSRFFGDLKLSLLQKESVWVIESGKKIVWILGLRIDDRFKVEPRSLNIVKLTLAPAAR